MDFVYGVLLLWAAFQALLSLIGSDLMSTEPSVRYKKWKIYRDKYGRYYAKYISFKLWWVIPIYCWYHKEGWENGHYYNKVVRMETFRDMERELETNYNRHRPIKVERVNKKLNE